MTRPFELSPGELPGRMDEMIDGVFDDLQSQFLVMPKGSSFLDYVEFRDAYEAIRTETAGFDRVELETLWSALRRNARALLVLRSILGFSPPEWQERSEEFSDISFVGNYARGLDSKVKKDPGFFVDGAGATKLNKERVSAMLKTAIRLLSDTDPDMPDGTVHRLQKYDTLNGFSSIGNASDKGFPYAVVLYERFLGRPFASHRDSVSELVGDVMEAAIEQRLTNRRVPFRQAGRAERFGEFDQAPDFFIPDEIAPAAIIEAKISSDDGTARDKVSRILRLAAMRDSKLRKGEPSWELIACIDGRGFKTRRQDMNDLLLATQGKIFTAKTLDLLVDSTVLGKFSL